MRNVRTVVILSILLLVSIVGFYLSTALNSAESDEMIYKLESGSVRAIRITSPVTAVGFEKKDGKWVMVKPAEYKINEELVCRLAVKLEKFYTLRVIEKTPVDLKRYGLDTPEMSVCFRLEDGSEKTLLIGGESASKYQRYVRDSHGDIVYSVSSTDTEAFGNGNPSFYRDRSLLSADKADINLLTVNMDGKTELQLIEYEAGKWQFREPGRANAKNDEVNEILKGVCGLTIKEFIEDDPVDLKQYGLDKPAFIIEVGDRNGKLQNIRFGHMDDVKKEAYVSMDEEKGVYNVSIRDFNPKEIKMADLLNEAPLSIGIDSGKTVEINDRGVITKFMRDQIKPDDNVFTLNGKATKKEDFIAFYVDLMSLTSEGYDAANTGESPELSILYEAAEGDGRIVLALSRRDDSTYFLTVDGQPLPYYVSAQKVDLARRWLKRVKENQ